MSQNTIKDKEVIINFAYALWRVVREARPTLKDKKPYRKIITNLEQYWIDNEII